MDCSKIKCPEMKCPKLSNWREHIKWPSRLAKIAKDFHQAHGRNVLIAVVLLNITDCVLVLTELILDMLYYTGLLAKLEHIHLDFYKGMTEKYPNITNNAEYLPNHKSNPDAFTKFLDKILNSFTFIYGKEVSKNISPNTTVIASYCHRIVKDNKEPPKKWTCDTHLDMLYKYSNPTIPSECAYTKKDQNQMLGNPEYHENLEKILLDVSHNLHYVGLIILCFLFLYVIFKIVCDGRHFFTSRMQVFDGFAVVLSLVLDAVFVGSASDLNSNTEIIELVVMLIWRIIRVLNSLIVAVMDKQNLQIRMMKKEKKVAIRALSENISKMEMMQHELEMLQAIVSPKELQDHNDKARTGFASLMEGKVSQQAGKMVKNFTQFSKNIGSKIPGLRLSQIIPEESSSRPSSFQETAVDEENGSQTDINHNK